jgi:hypothetical protein
MDLIINTNHNSITIYNAAKERRNNFSIVFCNNNEYPIKLFFINTEYILEKDEITRISLGSINATCYNYYYYILEFFKIKFYILHNNRYITTSLILNPNQSLIFQKLTLSQLIIKNPSLFLIKNLIVEFLSNEDNMLEFNGQSINLDTGVVSIIKVKDYQNKEEIVFNYKCFNKNLLKYKISSKNTNHLEGELANSFIMNFRNGINIYSFNLPYIHLEVLILNNYNVLRITNYSDTIFNNYSFKIQNINFYNNSILYFNSLNSQMVLQYDLIDYNMQDFTIASQSFFIIPYMLLNNDLQCTIYDNFNNKGQSIILPRTRNSKIRNVLIEQQYDIEELTLDQLPSIEDMQNIENTFYEQQYDIEELTLDQLPSTVDMQNIENTFKDFFI